MSDEQTPFRNHVRLLPPTTDIERAKANHPSALFTRNYQSLSWPKGPHSPAALGETDVRPDNEHTITGTVEALYDYDEDGYTYTVDEPPTPHYVNVFFKRPRLYE